MKSQSLLHSYEAPRAYARGIFSPLLRRERNPSEAENTSPSSASSHSRFSAKGDKKKQKRFKLGREVNLMDVYPRSNRPIEERFKSVTIADRLAARQFEKEYFDGTRNQGFGGYNYNPKFWLPVAKRIKSYYRLQSDCKILIVGCSKGFLMHDFKQVLPKATVIGIDISKYAIENCLEDIKPFVSIGNAKELPYPNNTFDLVVSINTIHNLPLEDCFKALQEIQRVGKKNKFIIVDAWRTDKERQNMAKWVLTGLTVLSTNDWKELFRLAGYTGDFYWFIAE